MGFRWLYRWFFSDILAPSEKHIAEPSMRRSEKILCASQLEYLVTLLATQLDTKVHYVLTEHKRAARFLSDGEVLARLTLHPKGLLRRQHYIKVTLASNHEGSKAWFQLAFLGSPVRFGAWRAELLRQI